MTAELQNDFETMLDENKKLIHRQLASVNVYPSEIEPMLDAYEKSIRGRVNEYQVYKSPSDPAPQSMNSIVGNRKG